MGGLKLEEEKDLFAYFWLEGGEGDAKCGCSLILEETGLLGLLSFPPLLLLGLLLPFPLEFPFEPFELPLEFELLFGREFKLCEL